MNYKALKLGIFISIAQIGTAMACELCKKNQPKVLENITHGTGPQGDIDYIIIWSAVVIVSITLFLSAKYLIRPNEDEPSHIKNIVIEKI